MRVKPNPAVLIVRDRVIQLKAWMIAGKGQGKAFMKVSALDKLLPLRA
jgi:hypothetical protein